MEFKRAGLVLAIVTCLILVGSHAVAGTWTTKAPMPTARGSLAVGVVDGILYAVGGEAGGVVVATVEAYDPTTDTWTTKAPMPTARRSLAVGVVNGILYAVGGHNGAGGVLATVEAYDPVTDSWVTKTSMPTPRQALSAGVVGGLLYALEGANAPGNSPIAAVEAYDSITNTWTSKALPLIAAFFQGAGVVSNTLYAVGGGNGATCFTANQAYDAADNSWTTRASMATDRIAPGVGVVGGILYVAGGGSCAGLVASGEAYDPATDMWTGIPPMPGGARYLVGAGVVNGVVYVVGGSNNVVSLATNEAFSPLSPFTAFLHGTGSTLFLDGAAPTATTAKFRDSPALSIAGGNPWKQIGTWSATPGVFSGTLSGLGDVTVWLGLKNSDDIGTRFDLRAEVLKNDALISSSEVLCITGLTRNAAQAKQVAGSFDAFEPAEIDGSADVLSLRVLARIGTNGAGASCGGHSNAVGLRLYFDAVSRPSRVEGGFLD